MGQDRREECCVREERVFLEFLWSRRCSCRCGRCEACFQSFNGGHPRVAEHCEDRDCEEHCESQRDVHGGERRVRRPVREGFPSESFVRASFDPKQHPFFPPEMKNH